MTSCCYPWLLLSAASPHLQEIHALRAAELQEAVSQGVMLLTLELPVFPHAVLYQQSLSAAAVVAQAAGAPGAAASASAAGAGSAAGSASGVADIIRFQDPEVGLWVGWCLGVCSQGVVDWRGGPGKGPRGVGGMRRNCPRLLYVSSLAANKGFGA